VIQQDLALGHDIGTIGRACRAAGSATVWLDGRGGFADGWQPGALLAYRPRVVAADSSDPQHDLAMLERRILERRAAGGTAETGVAVVLGYESLAPQPRPTPAATTPAIAILEVDRSLRLTGPGSGRLTLRLEGDPPAATARAALDRLRAVVEQAGGVRPCRAARAVGRPRTSLRRERYLAAVEAVRARIARGDIYQANLCRRFEVECDGDPFELYLGLVAETPAPHSAFVEIAGWALVSASPETFLRATPDGSIETLPIKGTRPRDPDPRLDARAAQALLASAKDRAELLMIVDLERNDLGRVCRTGSVGVAELAGLRSFAVVHHLVARVTGKLRAEVGPQELIRATFPGGSISGAPKRRAIEILRELEPAPRGWFTGSLLWFGDDGSLDSSILIRSLVIGAGRAWLGAGGGVVADSDPLLEWQESNHKARALAARLGFAPEEAR